MDMDMDTDMGMGMDAATWLAIGFGGVIAVMVALLFLLLWQPDG